MRGQKNKVFLTRADVRNFVSLIILAICISLLSCVVYVCLASSEDVLMWPLAEPKEMDGGIKTSLRDGDVVKVIQLDLIPQIQTLATGTVLNDEIVWGFEDALFYVEAPSRWMAEGSMGHYLGFSLSIEKLQISSYACQAMTGIYNIRSLSYTKETREFTDADGETYYRCAVTGMSVESWRSPYGNTCSREEALEYYNKCSAQIKSVVADVIAARSPDGEPLGDVERLKYIHDWLIMNADYAYEKQDLSPIKGFYHIRNEYGALVDGEAVCIGYTYAFKALVDELVRQTGAEIECEEATSRTHSWARVKLGGEWYNVDVTWDECNSSPEYISRKYFLVSDDVISDDAHQDRSSVSSVRATNKQYEGKDWGKSLATTS